MTRYRLCRPVINNLVKELKKNKKKPLIKYQALLCMDLIDYNWLQSFDRLVTAPPTPLSGTSLLRIKVIWGTNASILRLGRYTNTRTFVHFKSVYLQSSDIVYVCARVHVWRTDMLHHCNPTILPHLSLTGAGYRGQLAFTTSQAKARVISLHRYITQPHLSVDLQIIEKSKCMILHICCVSHFFICLVMSSTGVTGYLNKSVLTLTIVVY